MKRRRYTSPAKRRMRKRILLVLGVVAVALALLLLALPTITNGRVTPLPFQKSGSAVGNSPNPSKTPFRWPWQKEETAEATPTPTPSPLVSSAPAEQEDIPTETPQSAISVPREPYPIQLDITLSDSNQIEVVEQITHTNQSSHTQSSLVLHFPAAALVDGGLSRLTFDGLSNENDYSLDAQQGLLTLPLNQILLPGESLRVTLAYTLNLPEETAFLSYDSSEGTYVLMDFYAYLAAYEEFNDRWLPETTLGLPMMDITANITMPPDYTLANSGQQKNHSSLSTGMQRVLVEDLSSYRFGLATGAGNLRYETVTLDELSITNYAPRSSTVVRISELSTAILQYYGGYLGYPSADGNGINIMSTELDSFCITVSNLVLYNAESFSETNEFRYQFAVALARLYFPEKAGTDENTEAFNELLCHALAASYVESSQSAELAAEAYAHLPEGESFMQIMRGLPEGSMGDALQQYRASAALGVYDVQNLYTVLPTGAAPSVESLLLSYRQRMESGAAYSAPVNTADGSADSLASATSGTEAQMDTLPQ